MSLPIRIQMAVDLYVYLNLPSPSRLSYTHTHSFTHSLTTGPTRMYMNLVERCFDTCVHSFRSKELASYETSCLENCGRRYVKAANRTGLRFQEHQALQMKRAQDAAAANSGIGG